MYRGDVANNALKMAGQELGVLAEKSEVSRRHARYADLSDEQILKGIMEKARLLLEWGKATVMPSNASGNAQALLR